MTQSETDANLEVKHEETGRREIVIRFLFFKGSQAHWLML